MKKRYGLFCLITAVLFGISPPASCAGEAYAQDAPAEESQDIPEELTNLYARSAVLMDGDSGRVLFGKEENEVHPMASTTKIMTCILALENMEEDQIVTASDLAVCQPKVRLGVKGQEQFYLKDILYSLMLESHNDSAVVTAEGIAGTVGDFAQMMNGKARELGCEHTYFVTPNGLDGFDDGGTHSTTARDLARIMKYCITESPKKEAFLQITQTKTYQFTDVDEERSFSCNNHNAFLDMMEGAVSGKTGFTADAGYCYVGALQRDGRTFIVALLACGWPNNKGYKWSDTKKLMTYGIDHYQYQNVWKPMDLQPITVRNAVPDGGKLSGTAGARIKIKFPPEELPVLLGDREEVAVQCDLKKQISAPVKKGETVGEISYTLHGKTIKRFKVVTAEDVKKRTFGWCLSQITRRLCCGIWELRF